MKKIILGIMASLLVTSSNAQWWNLGVFGKKEQKKNIDQQLAELFIKINTEKNFSEEEKEARKLIEQLKTEAEKKTKASELEKILSSKKTAQVTEEKTQVSNELEKARTDIQDLKKQLAEAKSEPELTNIAIKNLQKNLKIERKKVADLTTQLEETKKVVKWSEGQEDCLTKLHQFEESHQKLQHEFAEKTKKIQVLEKAQVEPNEALTASQKEISLLNVDKEKLSQDLQGAIKKLEEVTKQKEEATKKLEELALVDVDKKQLIKEVEQDKKRLEDLTKFKEEATKKLEEADKNNTLLVNGVDDLRIKLHDVQQEKDKLEIALKEAKKQNETVGENIDKAFKECKEEVERNKRELQAKIDKAVKETIASSYKLTIDYIKSAVYNATNQDESYVKLTKHYAEDNNFFHALNSYITQLQNLKNAVKRAANSYGSATKQVNELLQWIPSA
jgi:chromosome segregation ATPase